MRTFTAMLMGLLVTTAAIYSLSLPGEGNQMLAIAVVVGGLIVMGIPMIIVSLKNANRQRPSAAQPQLELTDVNTIDVSKSRQVLTDKVAKAVRELKNFEERLYNGEIDLDNAEEPLEALESFIDIVQSETADLNLNKEKLRKISVELNEEGETEEANAFYGKSEQLGRLSQEGKDAITELYKWSAVVRAKIAARSAVISVNREESAFSSAATPSVVPPIEGLTAPSFAIQGQEAKAEDKHEVPFRVPEMKNDEEMDRLMKLFSDFRGAHAPLKNHFEELQRARRTEEDTLLKLRDNLAVNYTRLNDIMREVEKELSALRIRQAGLEYKNRQFSDQILLLRGRLPALSGEGTTDEKRQDLKREIEELEKAIRKVRLKSALEEKLNGSLMKRPDVGPVNIYKQDEILLTNRLNEMVSESQKLEEYEIRRESINELIKERTARLQANSEQLKDVNTQVSLQTGRYQHYEKQQKCLQEINGEIQAAHDFFDSRVIPLDMSAPAGVDVPHIDVELIQGLYKEAGTKRAQTSGLTETFEKAKAKTKPVLECFRHLYILMRDETRHRLKVERTILDDLKTKSEDLSRINKDLVEEIERLNGQLPGADSGQANLAMLGDLKSHIAEVERAIKKVKYKSEFTAGLNIKDDESLTFDLKDADARRERVLQEKLLELSAQKRQLEEYLIRKETLDEMIKDRQQSLFRNTQQINNLQNKIVPLELEIKFIKTRNDKITRIEQEWEELSKIVPVIIGTLDEPIAAVIPQPEAAEDLDDGIIMPDRHIAEKTLGQIQEGRTDGN